MGQYNPSAPCALGPEWMPYRDGVAFLDSLAKVAGAAVESTSTEDIEAMWVALCARFSDDNVLLAEVFDITGDELPDYTDLETRTYLPAADLYGFSLFGVGEFNGYDSTEWTNDADDFYRAVDNTVNDPGFAPFGQSSPDKDYVYGLAGQAEYAARIDGINGDHAGRWITSVRLVCTCLQVSEEKTEAAMTIEGFLRFDGVTKGGGAQSVGANAPPEGKEVHWEWFANPWTGEPWTPEVLNKFDGLLGLDTGIGFILRGSGTDKVASLVTQMRLEVISAPTDQRLAYATVAPRYRQGWQRMVFKLPNTGAETAWAKEDGKKYLICFRKSRGYFPLALCHTSEPDRPMAGPPHWTSFLPETSAQSELNPSVRPRELREEGSLAYGIGFEQTGGSFSPDSNPYVTTSPTEGPDAWPFIGAFFDLPPVNEERTIEQEFTTEDTVDYGWLQLRLALMTNVVEHDLVAEVLDRATDTVQITFTVSPDDMGDENTPKREWQRIGLRCDEPIPPTLNAATQYYLRLRSDAPADNGWLAQVLNGGTNGEPPQAPPAGMEAMTFGGTADKLTAGGVELKFADLEFVLSTLPPTPLDIAAVPAGEVCGIDYNIVTWADPGGISGCGLDFAGWEVHRSYDLGETWYRAALITDQAVTSQDDQEVRSNREMQYRVRTVREDGARSDWTDVVSSTAEQTEVGLIFCSNILPDRALFANDIEEERVYEYDENVTFEQYQGRKFQVAHVELEDRGLTAMETRILVRAGKQLCGLDPCMDYSESGASVFEPLRLFLKEPLPYICVRNECGDVWLAKVLMPKGTQRRGTFGGSPADRDPRGNYVADVKVVQVSDRPYAPDAAIGFGSGSGSGA